MIFAAGALPIVQAPMAGGSSTPALAAAVSEAGGLGFLAAGYKSVEAMRADIAATRELTSRPFGMNIFMPLLDEIDRPLLPPTATASPPTPRAWASRRAFRPPVTTAMTPRSLICCPTLRRS